MVAPTQVHLSAELELFKTQSPCTFHIAKLVRTARTGVALLTDRRNGPSILWTQCLQLATPDTRSHCGAQSGPIPLRGTHHCARQLHDDHTAGMVHPFRDKQGTLKYDFSAKWEGDLSGLLR